MSVPCPVCDLDRYLERYGNSPVSAMALGVALGSAFGEPYGVTERVCDRHRSSWVSAMMHAAILCNTVDEDDEEQ